MWFIPPQPNLTPSYWLAVTLVPGEKVYMIGNKGELEKSIMSRLLKPKHVVILEIIPPKLPISRELPVLLIQRLNLNHPTTN